VIHFGVVEDAMTDFPDWIEPGQTATLIWYDGVQDRGDGARTYQVAGPVLDIGPASPYFLLAPLEQSEFAERLYRGEVTLPALRSFLDHCILAEGSMSEGLDVVFTRAEARLLPVLDAWRALPDRPVLTYRADLDAFLGDGLPLYVSSDAYGAAQRSLESFATAWVCAGCGEAEDAAVFFWTLARDRRVRVCFLIQNEGGRWTCHLHPFEFETELT
jgi:hypothetical protein